MVKGLRAVVGVVIGFVAGVVLGAALIALFSSNTHDKSVEMAMTAAFVTGPIGAVIGLIAALLRKAPGSRTSNGEPS